MLLFVALVFAAVLLWLRSYTNHGQKLELPQYEKQAFAEAQKDAEKKSFELIINDSIHIVGQPGGVIWNQNPRAGALVKENRKIYVDVTKYNADLIDLKSLGTLYGQQYDRISKMLSTRKIKTSIKGYTPDNGEPDHILEVYYKNKLVAGGRGAAKQLKNIKIAKGDVLDFILSKRSGFKIAVPDVSCKTLSQAAAFLKFSKLNLGTITQKGAITDKDNAYVISQFPDPSSRDTVLTGTTFSLEIQQEKPVNCH